MSWNLLRNRNFALLWTAQILSTLGNELYNIGMMVTIFERTGSALQTAGVLIARTTPSLLLGPFAGVLVDRYSRRSVLVAMNLARAALLAAMLFFVGAEQVGAWAGYAVVFGLAGAAIFSRPAQQAILPDLVPESELVRANSLLMSSNQAILTASYAVGGVLILWLGFSTLVGVGLVAFLLAALASAFIVCCRRSSDEQLGRPDIPFLRAVLEGLAYLRGHRLARPLVVMETLEHWPHGIWTSALMLVFTRQALQAGPEDWGYQASAYFAGMLVGATVAVLVSAHLARRPGWVIISNAFLFSLLTFGYALSPTVLIAVVFCFVFGPPSAMRDVTQDALLQASVHPDLLGRIYATRDTLTSFAFLLAGLAFAWLADQVAVRWVYLIGGALYLGTALYALSSPAIRHSRLEAVDASP
jgi:MFS family permease